MSTPTFPPYAELLLSGFSQKRESALMRTEMDSGFPKVAKVRTSVMVTRQATIHLPTKANLLDFQSWYSNECNEGASWFYFKDPVTLSNVTARFSEGGFTATPLSSVSGGWTISLKIETWG